MEMMRIDIMEREKVTPISEEPRECIYVASSGRILESQALCMSCTLGYV